MIAALELGELRLESGGSSSELLERMPWLVSDDPMVLARAAVRVCWPKVNGRISLEQELRLLQAAEQIERTGYAGLTGPAAAAAAILDTAQDLPNVLGSWRGPTPRPRSLGAMGVGLRRVAHREVNWERARRARRRPGPALDCPDDLERREVVDVALGGVEARVPELLADDV
ncbi:MAG TPA: hypothetical protein VG186_00880, partial [Solirubrobacteraceae bacterium]|nr:hypothetical protein [Solirubrobacteraceae bacterium]